MPGSLESALAGLTRAAQGAEARSRGTMLRVTIVDDSQARGRGVDRIFDAFELTMDRIPAVMVADMVPAIREAHAENFDTEGSSGRGGWEGLSPVTLAERVRLGFGSGPILTRTGALRSHVLAAPVQITRSGGGYTLRIEPDASVGGVPKYRALAMGYSPNNLPGRPMVTVGPGGARSITSALQRGLRAAALANGLG